MSLGWTLLGTFGQLMLAYFLFMCVAFSAGGIASGRRLRKLQMQILDLAIFVLPGACVLSAGMVLYLDRHGGSAMSYWRYVMPLAVTALYIRYVIVLGRGFETKRTDQEDGGNEFAIISVVPCRCRSEKV